MESCDARRGPALGTPPVVHRHGRCTHGGWDATTKKNRTRALKRTFREGNGAGVVQLKVEQTQEHRGDGKAGP